MKGLIFRYFSLLLLFLVIGVNLFGSEGSKGNIPVSDKENIEKASEEFQVSTTPFDQHGVFERTLEFSSRQIVNNGSREQFSLSFYRKTDDGRKDLRVFFRFAGTSTSSRFLRVRFV